MRNHGTMTEVIRIGSLLIATPALTDPNFDRTVVFLLDNNDNGALGVVINRPTPVPVANVLPPWSGLVTAPDMMFQGGPVGLDRALGLAAAPGSSQPLGWRRVIRGIGLVDLDAPPEVLAGDLGGLRIFAGYAGWSPGQLDDEVREGAWYVVDSEIGDIFSSEPEQLWRSVLRRQQGSLSLLATYPEDPSMN